MYCTNTPWPCFRNPSSLLWISPTFIVLSSLWNKLTVQVHMMTQLANPLANPFANFSFLDSLRSGRSSMSTPVYTVVAAVSSPQLSSDVRKNEESSSRLKGKTDGVLAGVYIHNTPEGICYRFLYVRLGSLSAASTSTVAVQIIKGFRPRAERLEQDMGGFTVNRMKGNAKTL